LNMCDMRDALSSFLFPPPPPPPFYPNSPPTRTCQDLEPLPSVEGCGPDNYVTRMAQDDKNKGLPPPRHDEEGDDEEGVTTTGEGLPPQQDSDRYWRGERKQREDRQVRRENEP